MAVVTKLLSGLAGQTSARPTNGVITIAAIKRRTSTPSSLICTAQDVAINAANAIISGSVVGDYTVIVI